MQIPTPVLPFLGQLWLSGRLPEPSRISPDHHSYRTSEDIFITDESFSGWTHPGLSTMPHMELSLDTILKGSQSRDLRTLIRLGMNPEPDASEAPGAAGSVALHGRKALDTNRPEHP
ncbi:hypothetical protein H920_04707 [Fukomys damarensis]|uniref:Uncharacterized protein n=1 Tax=Fukomys damarensis TaxID=885580 RepID=A0A091DTE9_FUKDA|nr:hypothetical protein H920_04707 [Fukomys damarensis]